MIEAIKNFNKQFKYEPKIENKSQWIRNRRFIVAGMGGSHLAADILKAWDRQFDIIVHRNYQLPVMPVSELKNYLVIASSYSGNTEESIDAFKKARKEKIPVAAIATGGKLISLAEEARAPYIQMPDAGIQPRLALGFSLMAILKMMGKKKMMAEATLLADSLDSLAYESAGQSLARKMNGFVPVIYSSDRNTAIAYNWKIKFNETGKIPAFYNVFPELNHNEMTGFDVRESSKKLSCNFYFILIKDFSDHPRVIRRMEVLEKLYRERGLSVEVIDLEGNSRPYEIFSSLILADWAAYYTAKQYGLEPEQVPMVEEFKKLI